MELKEIRWDHSVIEAVWKKGKINPDYSPEVLRWDDFGRIMMRTKYGRTDSRFGWTIDAVKPLTDGGLNDLENLRPLSIYHSDHFNKDMESPSTGGV